MSRPEYVKASRILIYYGRGSLPPINCRCSESRWVTTYDNMGPIIDLWVYAPYLGSTSSEVSRVGTKIGISIFLIKLAPLEIISTLACTPSKPAVGLYESQQT